MGYDVALSLNQQAELNGRMTGMYTDPAFGTSAAAANVLDDFGYSIFDSSGFGSNIIDRTQNNYDKMIADNYDMYIKRSDVSQNANAIYNTNAFGDMFDNTEESYSTNSSNNSNSTTNNSNSYQNGDVITVDGKDYKIVNGKMVSVEKYEKVAALTDPDNIEAQRKYKEITQLIHEIAYDTENGTTAENVGKGIGGVAVGAGGVAAGVAIGAAVGSAVPIVGTIIGGLVGGAIGFFAGKAAGGAIGSAVDKANGNDPDSKAAKLQEMIGGLKEEEFIALQDHFAANTGVKLNDFMIANENDKKGFTKDIVDSYSAKNTEALNWLYEKEEEE